MLYLFIRGKVFENLYIVVIYKNNWIIIYKSINVIKIKNDRGIIIVWKKFRGCYKFFEMDLICKRILYFVFVGYLFIMF